MTGPSQVGRSPFSGAARHADDTRRRFLAAVVARVPLERIVEVHLFSPIRQGGVETGVAVVAAELPVVVMVAAEPEPAPVVAESLDAPMCDPTEDASRGAEPTAVEEAADDVPSNDEPSTDAPPPEAPVDAMPTRSAPLRHTVFMARYRMTVKGPDRGRWDADVVEEADAPLVTVEAVVRGVQRRAGDAAGAERLGPDDVARILGGLDA